MPISELLILILTGLVMLVGLAGTIVPVLPGPTLILLAAAGYGLLTGFGENSGQLLATMALLAVASGATRLWLAKSGASRGGASRQSMLLGLALAVMGFFVLPVIGALIGGVLGIYLAEYSRTQDRAKAWQATRGVLLGFGASYLLEVVAALVMVGMWIVWVWPG